ncbi:DNA mismatch repair protein MutT [Mesorhizobium sp. L2C054A000]|nr:DNA mismatch repair protein MutT [Mesorhizobium sp. L2C054A000]
MRQIFLKAGIEVIAPVGTEIVTAGKGFSYLSGDDRLDARAIELIYLGKLRRLAASGFSYFVNPNGYIGKSVSYELGIAQITNTRCFFYDHLTDHPAYVHGNAVWKPDALAEYIKCYGRLPLPQVKGNERVIHKLWESLTMVGSIVAAGAIIEHVGTNEVLLVRTHKWAGRYSIVGGRVRRNERLRDALLREVREETGLSGSIGHHIATFDQIGDNDYYRPGVQHLFVDNVVAAEERNVHLNEEAEDFIWAPAIDALKELDLEPNARHTLEAYAKLQARLADGHGAVPSS